MSTPLRLGIAGLGTVGTGVVRIVQTEAALIAARAGRPVEVVAVSARDRRKTRDVDLSAYAWEDDPVALARRADVDVFVELMGGDSGPAKAATEAAIAAGKDVVTANKALLAHHGQALAEAAEAKGRCIRFEAAVAGGIPVIKALTEGLAANRIRRVMGVMNGTCNYILTRMPVRWGTWKRTPPLMSVASMPGTSCRCWRPSPLAPRSASTRWNWKASAASRSRISAMLPTWGTASSCWVSRN